MKRVLSKSDADGRTPRQAGAIDHTPATPEDFGHGPILSSPREGEELLALAQEAGGLGIFEWEVGSGTVRLSPKLQALYGLTDFDGRYDTWRKRVFREDVARITHTIEQAFAAQITEIVDEFRIAGTGDDASRWMETRSIVFYGDDGRPDRVVGVSVDVTERKRAVMQLRAFAETLEDRVKARTRELEAENEARRQAEESLRQAQKMEVIGQLTGGVAHDFNNLLTIVMGGLEIIERQLPSLPDSPATQRIDRARKLAIEGVQRAAKLTERLLAFARRQPLTPQPIDPDELVSGLSDLLRRTIGETISLVTIPAGRKLEIHADPNQLENTLLNLVINARDAMPDGGKLTIEMDLCYLDQSYTTKMAEPVTPGNYVLIAVADTGVGMDPGTIEHAFEPFFTTKEVGKGTGLGLSQVYGFVRQSSGHIRIYSEPGHGTSVKIYLPYYSGSHKINRNPPREPKAGGAIGTESILVVEDDHSLRAYTTEILRDLGYAVSEADHGAAALRVLEETQPIDLLFTDIVMPGGMNGRQLADAAMLRQPGLKVLYTTGYSRNAVGDQGRLDPNLHVVGKPFSIDTLARKVRNILDGDEGG